MKTKKIIPFILSLVLIGLFIPMRSAFADTSDVGAFTMDYPAGAEPILNSGTVEVNIPAQETVKIVGMSPGSGSNLAITGGTNSYFGVDPGGVTPIVIGDVESWTSFAIVSGIVTIANFISESGSAVELNGGTLILLETCQLGTNAIYPKYPSATIKLLPTSIIEADIGSAAQDATSYTLD